MKNKYIVWPLIPFWVKWSGVGGGKSPTDNIIGKIGEFYIGITY